MLVVIMILVVPILFVITILVIVVIILAIQWWVVNGYEQQGVPSQMAVSAK